MADETDNETTPTPEAEAQAPEAPVEETAGAERTEAPAEESAAETPAEEPAAAQQAPPEAAAPAPPAEPQEQLAPKERRRRARSKHTAAQPQRTPEERHAERVAERRVKAVRRSVRRAAERKKAAERRAAAGPREPLAPVHAPVEGERKTRLGRVVSAKADKTITVRIDVARRHRRYEKIVRSSSTLHAHDENNDAHEGDLVRVVESRPLSKTKRWRLVDVLERAR